MAATASNWTKKNADRPGRRTRPVRITWSANRYGKDGQGAFACIVLEDRVTQERLVCVLTDDDVADFREAVAKEVKA